MSHNRSESGPSLIELVIQSDREGLMPDQVLRRIGLYGYAEGDLDVVVEEFNGQIDAIRRFFKDTRHTFKDDGRMEASHVAEAIRAEQVKVRRSSTDVA